MTVRYIFLAEGDAVYGDCRAFRYRDGKRACLGVQRIERRRFSFPRAAGLIVSRVQSQKIVFSGGENINRRIS